VYPFGKFSETARYRSAVFLTDRIPCDPSETTASVKIDSSNGWTPMSSGTFDVALASQRPAEPALALALTR
jgi:hypothetical protein